MLSANGGRDRELERIRYVAANYEHLQGLRKVPLRIFMLVVVSLIVLSLVWTAVGDGAFPTPYALGSLALVFLLFVAGIVAPHFISIRYERRYGTVQRFKPVPGRRKVLYVTMILALILGGSLPLLAMGIAMVAAYWPERRFQGHYVVIGAPPFACSSSIRLSRSGTSPRAPGSGPPARRSPAYPPWPS